MQRRGGGAEPQHAVAGRLGGLAAATWLALRGDGVRELHRGGGVTAWRRDAIPLVGGCRAAEFGSWVICVDGMGCVGVCGWGRCGRAG
jgi:hypothetical protein